MSTNYDPLIYFLPKEAIEELSQSVSQVEKVDSHEDRLALLEGAGSGSEALNLIQNGFTDRDNSTLSWDDATRTLTITPVTPFSFISGGILYEKIAAESIVIPAVEGRHFVYYNSAGSLVTTDAFTADLIQREALVAYIYWDADNSEAILVGDERHGREMDGATHNYLHSTIGAMYESGLALQNIVADQNGDDAEDAQLAVQDGVIRDEDIRFSITNGAPQTLSPIAEIPVFYRLGAGGLWRRSAATLYPVVNTGTGRAAWNENVAGTWQLTEVDNNDYVLIHFFATTDIFHPVIAIMGQAEYNSAGAARDAAPAEISQLQTGQLDALLPEFKAIGTIILQTGDGKSNAVKSSIESTDGGGDYIDFRQAGPVPSGASSTPTAVVPESFTVATLPAAPPAGTTRIIFVTDETGGPTIAYHNGTNWVRVRDDVVVS